MSRTDVFSRKKAQNVDSKVKVQKFVKLSPIPYCIFMYSVWNLNITPNQILLIILQTYFPQRIIYLYLKQNLSLGMFTFCTLYAHIAAPTKSMLLMIALSPCFLFYHFCNVEKIYVNMFSISFESVLNTFKYICVMCILKKTFNFMGK